MNKLQEFLAIINSKIGAGYVYGGQNAEPLTREALSRLVNTFGRSRYYYANYSAEKWLGYQYYDCSGLIVYTLRKMGLIPMIADYSAQSIYSVLCTPISKNQLRPGDLCFRNTTTNGIIHTGVYTGNNRVTHARGTFYGVANTVVFDTFNTFGRLNYFAADYGEIKINFEQSVKSVQVAANIYEVPDEAAAVIGKLEAGSSANIEAGVGGNWYIIKLTGKMGYIKLKALTDNDELLKALEFISEKSGINKNYWYRQAMNIKYLDLCFIAIARGFGGLPAASASIEPQTAATSTISTATSMTASVTVPVTAPETLPSAEQTHADGTGEFTGSDDMSNV
ncbi:MAG: cell wall-associated hydrolase, invasion-associated protein [Eubacterium sp.]|nr:cell wall-associated hydrolase, invasion-associated protein [Eubacterium sp.]